MKGDGIMLPRRMFLDNMLEDLEKEDNMKCDIYEKKGIIHIEMDIPSFDKKDIKHLLYKPSEMCFEEVSRAFRLIEEVGKTVFVNMDDSLQLIERMKTEGINYSLMKHLSQYSVNIHDQDFKKLLGYGAIEEMIEGIFVVNDRAQYDEKIGLRLDNHWMNEILMA